MDSEMCKSKTSFSKEYGNSTNNSTKDCGISGFRPKMFNIFNNILTFSIISGIVSVLASVTTYFSSQIPHLEKQFGLNSAEIGLIMSWSRIGYFMFSLFGSSIAQLVHIPLFMFWTILIYSIAGLCLSIPYFVIASTGQISPIKIDPSDGNDSSQPFPSNQSLLPNVNEYFFCEMNNLTNIGNSECGVKPQTGESSDWEYQFRTMASVVFSICLFVTGFTYACRYPFGVVYIDDNVDKAKTGFYVGMVYGIGIFGPAIAFAIGGVTSKIYVTLDDVDFSVNDPRWIGAWWLGFIGFSIGTIITALPLLCFPRQLKRKKPEEEKMKIQETHNLLSMNMKEKIKERALSYWRVLTTPMFVSIMFFNCVTSFPWVGYWSFISKYITTQFGIPLWKGNMILAVSNIVSLCAGCFGGGIISRKVKMTPRNCLLINALLTFISIVIFAFGFLAGCEQPLIIGPSKSEDLGFNSSNTCDSDCSCDENKYFPVCGSNGVTYHSPCYAGCPITSEKNAIFFNCSCVPDGKATAGLCPSDCQNLYPWAVVNFFSFFIDALTWIPMVTVWIRTVEDRDKSTAIGVQSVVGTLLSHMPAPIAYGKLIDTTCLIWESTCGVKGSCQLYNIGDLRITVHAVTVGMKFVGVLGFLFLLWKVWDVEAWENFQKKHKSKVRNDKEMETLT